MNKTIFTLNFSASDNLQQNQDRMLGFLETLGKNHAGAWVVIPEMFAYMGSYSRLCEAACFVSSSLLPKLQAVAKDLGITLFAGSVPVLGEAEEIQQGLSPHKVFNTALVISPGGEILHKYRKIHLFNLRGPTPERSYCESDGFHAGPLTPCVFKHEGWRVALCICYDLRFPELFLRFHEEAHPDVIVIPSAFTHYTGSFHWEVLLRARAIENQCYVVGSNQTGVNQDHRALWGHSMIVDPWGQVLQDAGEPEGYVSGEISQSQIAKVREELPALANRITTPSHAK